MRRLVMVLLIVAAAGACRGGVNGDAGAGGVVWLTDAQIRGEGIIVAPALEQEVSASIVTGGRVVLDDSRVAHVYSEVAGRVVRIDAALGQHVKQGDALATLDSPDVGLASADVRKAEADLVAAEHDYARQKMLFEKQATSRAQYEQAEDIYLRAKAERDRVREKLRLLRGGRDGRITQSYTLYSPIDGEVLARAVSPGLEVQGLYSGGSPGELFTIGNTDRVWVLGDVHESDLDRVKVGAPVRVAVISYPREAFLGSVDWVASVLDPATRTARVRCSLANEGNLLKPEMYATVSIATADEKALALPRDAVIRLGDQTMVFVEGARASDGRTEFSLRPVTVDEPDSGPWVVVQRGVEKGTRVVVSGASLLASRGM